MRRINNKLKIMVLSLILLLGIGFAAITTTLTITGNSSITGDSENFQNNIFFASASLTSTGLRAEDTNTAQPRINGKTMTFTIPATSALKAIGDKIEVEYTIRNESNYKALIAVPTVTSSSTDFLEYFTVTHSRTANLELGVDTTSPTQTLTLTLKKTYADTNIKNFTFTVSINATAMEATTPGSNNELGRERPIETITGNGHNVGDEVAIGDEHFYVIGTEGNNTKLLTKYNLYVGRYQTMQDWVKYKAPLLENPTGIQNEIARGNTNTIGEYGFPNYGMIDIFENEWDESEFTAKYGNTYPMDIFVDDENSKIKKHVDYYKEYLENLNVTITNARLITYNELVELGCDPTTHSCSSAPSWVYLTSYWTSTASEFKNVWSVCIYDIRFSPYDWNNYGNHGIRPVIVVPSNQI